IPSRAGVVWSVAFAPDDRSLAFGSGTGSMEGAGEVSILRCASPERVSKQQRELRVESLSKSCDQLARAGNWEAALEAMNELVELEPMNHWNYHRLSPLFVAVGDTESYHQTSQKIKDLFRNETDPVAAERLANACLILPSPTADFRPFAR